MEILTKSAKETQKFGEKFASDIKASSGQRSVNKVRVLALTGELGSGKTTFVQGFAKGLGIKGRVISPTFILVREYDLPITHFYHVDLYRFEKDTENEVKNIGIKDLWSDPENIVVIEWAEKIKRIIPKNATWIKFEYEGENKRSIKVA